MRFGSKLLSKLNYLANGVSSSDYGPTDQHGEVQQLLNGQLRQLLAALDALLAQDVGALNDLLKARGIPNIIVGVRGIS